MFVDIHNISFPISTGIFIVIALNLKINLGRNDILNIVSLPTHEHGIFLNYSILLFISPEFYSFPNVSCIHILLGLYINISFFWC